MLINAPMTEATKQRTARLAQYATALNAYQCQKPTIVKNQKIAMRAIVWPISTMPVATGRGNADPRPYILMNTRKRFTQPPDIRLRTIV